MWIRKTLIGNSLEPIPVRKVTVLGSVVPCWQAGTAPWLQSHRWWYGNWYGMVWYSMVTGMVTGLPLQYLQAGLDVPREVPQRRRSHSSQPSLINGLILTSKNTSHTGVSAGSYRCRLVEVPTLFASADHLVVWSAGVFFGIKRR